MKDIFRTDIKEKKEFNRIGHHYTQVLADDEKHIYLYRMDKDGIRYAQYELVKGKKVKNPDGSIVFIYPSDEDFGTYGWYICGTPKYVTEKVREKWHSLTEHTPDFRVY